MNAEKPILLLINVMGSIALGLGISQYITGWMNHQVHIIPKKEISVTTHPIKKPSVPMDVPLVKSVDAAEAVTPSPSVSLSPTPTSVSTVSKTTPTPTKTVSSEKAQETNNQPQVKSTSPTPLPSQSPSPSAIPVTPTPGKNDQTEKKSIAGEVHGIANGLTHILPKKD